MSRLKRYYSKGNTYFVTIVTYERNRLLIEHIERFWPAFDKMKAKHDISLNAWVILPDHLHLIMTPADGQLDRFIHDLKLSFGVSVRIALGQDKGTIWQSRFWDHIIRDETDLNRHIDYIHYNPVKHKLTNSPFEWRHSSIHEFSRQGYYQPDWGVVSRYELDAGE